MTPFNFTAIAGNLPSAPAHDGQHRGLEVRQFHGLQQLSTGPTFRSRRSASGRDQFCSGRCGDRSATLSSGIGILREFISPDRPSVFQEMWRTVGENIAQYKSYPRLVGETGGKDFIIAHASADAEAVMTAIVRGGFEFQGQKCSAASRIYIPDTMWTRMRERLVATIDDIRMGDVADFSNFMGAVIDAKAFQKISGYIESRSRSSDATILAGGDADDSVGYFIRPTLIHDDDPAYTTMCEEIFGPVVTVYVYPEKEWRSHAGSGRSDFALCADRRCVGDRPARRSKRPRDVLRYAAGNFYINDKPTGAVVGQQPFGGARASGTNDKAGSMHESSPLGQRAHDQGNVPSATRLSLSIHEPVDSVQILCSAP